MAALPTRTNMSDPNPSPSNAQARTWHLAVYDFCAGLFGGTGALADSRAAFGIQDGIVAIPNDVGTFDITTAPATARAKLILNGNKTQNTMSLTAVGESLTYFKAHASIVYTITFDAAVVWLGGAAPPTLAVNECMLVSIVNDGTANRGTWNVWAS